MNASRVTALFERRSLPKYVNIFLTARSSALTTSLRNYFEANGFSERNIPVYIKRHQLGVYLLLPLLAGGKTAGCLIHILAVRLSGYHRGKAAL